MKFKLLTTAITLLITQTALASPANPVPCPSVQALKSVGVSTVSYGNGGWWGVRWNNDFNTKNSWSLFVGPLKVHGEDKVVGEANSQISKLIYADSDMYEGLTLCEYKGPDGVGAQAISTALAPSGEIFKLVR